MHNLKELKIWNKAMELASEVYKATSDFPSEERYGLTSQIRRSAVSIPSNIAEGAGRNSAKEFIYHLSVANGSSYELQTQLTLAQQLGLATQETIDPELKKIDEIQKMNYRLQEAITV